MHSFLVLILGCLFVSFHPSRFRSHSCSTGASLCPLPCDRFFVGIFCLPSAFFRPLQPASDYSAFCTFFSLLPDFPMQRFSSVLIFLISPACFYAFLQIVVLSVLRFLSPIIVSSHRTTSMSQLFPYGSQLISLGLRFRFRVVGIGISSYFRCFPAVYLGVSQAAPLY